MAMLVSLEETKRRLKIDTDAGDADLDLMILGASKSVMRYLKPLGCASFTDTDGSVIEDSDGIAADVPDDVKNATLMLIGIWRRDPSGVEGKDWEQGYLPRPVTSLLYPLRDPSIA